LVTLVPYMVFKHPLELENAFNGLMDDLWEVRRVLTPESYHLDLVRMVYAFIELSNLSFESKPFYYRLLDVGS